MLDLPHIIGENSKQNFFHRYILEMIDPIYLRCFYNKTMIKYFISNKVVYFMIYYIKYTIRKICDYNHLKKEHCSSPFFHLKEGTEKKLLSVRLRLLWHQGLALAAVRYLRSCRERKRA